MKGFFLGVDIGSLYTKFIVLNTGNEILYQNVTKTLNRNKQEQPNIINNIYSEFDIDFTCATGYGREHFVSADLVKSEISCSSIGLSELYTEEKTIIDIGGEDIKVITSSAEGKVIDFFMNTKCASGTGAFITEIAERAGIDLYKMSDLASKSSFTKELNSICTVFAKTEIMKWIFDDVPVMDLARGIYISVVNRISTIRMDKTLPIYMIGGVAAYHNHLKNVMEEKFQVEVIVPDNPQMVTAFGAAIISKKTIETNISKH